MDWQEILAAGAVALVSSAITAVFGVHLDRQRELERRRSLVADRIIDHFARLNRLAETSCGLHGALAASVERVGDDDALTDRRRRASEALNDAWYASRDLDVILQAGKPITERLRVFLRLHADTCLEQLEARRFDRPAITALGDVRTVLDELGDLVRTASGHDRLGS